LIKPYEVALVSFAALGVSVIHAVAAAWLSATQGGAVRVRVRARGQERESERARDAVRVRVRATGQERESERAREREQEEVRDPA